MIRKSEEGGRFLLRLPKELKIWLERESAYNGSSQNSEVIRALRYRMENQRPDRLELAPAMHAGTGTAV